MTVVDADTLSEWSDGAGDGDTVVGTVVDRDTDVDDVSDSDDPIDFVALSTRDTVVVDDGLWDSVTCAVGLSVRGSDWVTVGEPVTERANDGSPEWVGDALASTLELVERTSDSDTDGDSDGEADGDNDCSADRDGDAAWERVALADSVDDSEWDAVGGADGCTDSL